MENPEIRVISEVFGAETEGCELSKVRPGHFARLHLDPQKRELMSVVCSLESANDLVRYDPTPTGVTPFAGYPDTRTPAQRLRDEDKRLRAEHERGH